MSPQGILLIAITFICSALSGMGIGNAGLFVLYLVAVAGMEQLRAQGLNLVFFLLSAATALAVHLKRRRIPKRIAIVLAVASSLGAILGAFTAVSLPTDILRKLFGGMLVISGLFSLFGGRKKSTSPHSPPS